MKRLILALAMVFALALPSVSSAASGMYLAPKFLMTVQNTGIVDRSSSMGGLGLDPYSQFTLGGALAAGYDFWPQQMLPLRVEIEFAMRGNSETEWSGVLGTSEMTFNSTTLLANVYYDFHNSTAFTPYIGAGLGLAFNYLGFDTEYYNGDGYSMDDRQTNFAWQVGAGVAYAINENIAVDVAYRYLDLGYTQVDSHYTDAGIRPYNHEFMLGLRFGF